MGFLFEGPGPSATADGSDNVNPSATADGSDKINPSATADGSDNINPSATADGSDNVNPSATTHTAIFALRHSPHFTAQLFTSVEEL
jgi:hypothetical protein